MRPATTIKVFGSYAIAAGALLILDPNRLLAIFGVPPTQEVWIRVVGVLATALGLYYWRLAVAEARPFFVASIYGRVFAFAAFSAFVLAGLAPPPLLLFGVAELAGALWTAVALRRAPAEGDAAAAG